MSPDLTLARLSAQRALLGRITPEIRLVRVQVTGGCISLHVVAERDVPGLQEMMDEAATEIVADFSDKSINLTYEISSDPLPVENIIQAGWVYQRFEGDADEAG